MIFGWHDSSHVVSQRIIYTPEGPDLAKFRGLHQRGRRPDYVVLTKEELIRLGHHNDTQVFFRYLSYTLRSHDIRIAVHIDELDI